ncbi:MAG: AAA family ATPase, partial [Actinobacteria bacterium]|nr:AAA family ATPase [Actinomycetota bacterium]
PLKGLDQDSDLFNVLKKIEFIKLFLEKETYYLQKNNMVVLYGNWGSGKTTLIHSIEKHINKDFYKPVIFNAWRYEKDENLAYSLFEFLLDELKVKEDIKKQIRKLGGILLKGSLKSITVIGNIAEEYEKFLEKVSSEKSLYKKISEFETEFQSILKSNLEKDKILLVFVDDLDRCNPENVLDLLSSIKLFFTLGEESSLNEPKSRVIYFCGLDKDAAIKAAELKYRDKIKGEEFLEKIFDTSFYMPRNYNTENFVEKSKLFEEHKLIITSFFNSIKFTNPRHLKKIFNKYQLISLIKDNFANEFGELIPEIIRNKKGHIFDTILTLFFLILYEFHYQKYEEIKAYEFKFENYIEHLTDKSSKEISRESKGNIINNLRDNKSFFKFGNISNLKFLNPTEGHINYHKFLSFFTPRIYKDFEFKSVQDFRYFEQFEYNENQILIDFCRFIFDHIKDITIKEPDHHLNGDYNLFSLFDMVETLL